MKLFGPCLLTLALCLGARTASAEHLRCGGRLVSISMDASEVERICGAPAESRHRQLQVERTRTIRRRVAAPVTPAAPHGFVEVEDSETYVIPIDVDEWVFDLDPGQFVRVLIFENGRLVNIRSLGRGAEYSERKGRILETLAPYVPASRVYGR